MKGDVKEKKNKKRYWNLFKLKQMDLSKTYQLGLALDYGQSLLISLNNFIFFHSVM